MDFPSWFDQRIGLDFQYFLKIFNTLTLGVLVYCGVPHECPTACNFHTTFDQIIVPIFVHIYPILFARNLQSFCFVQAMPGVIDYVDHTDVPGLNNVVGLLTQNPNHNDEEIFSSGHIYCSGI